MFVYYDEGCSAQWVDASPNGVPTDLVVEELFLNTGLDVNDTGTPVAINSTNNGLNKLVQKQWNYCRCYGNNAAHFASMSDSSGQQDITC